MASPKSLEKLFAVVDLYDRARAKGAEISHTGDGGLRGVGQSGTGKRAEVGDRAGVGGAGWTGGCGPQVGSEPQVIADASEDESSRASESRDSSWASAWGGSESDLAEVLEVERRVNAFRRERGMDLTELDAWTADELRAARADSLTLGDHRPGRGPHRRTPPLPDLPGVGSVIELRKRLESFGGFILPGPVTIAAAGVDAVGGFVSFERDGRIVATGVTWPIGV